MVNDIIYKTIVKGDHKYHIIRPDQMMGAVAVIIEKERKALVVDTQFTKTNAINIVRVLREKQLTPEKIYISHSDPDYYFGTIFIKKFYPYVPVFATRYTVARIKKGYKSKLAYWIPILQEEAPKSVVVPKIIYGKLLFKGLEFRIIGNEPLKTTLYNEKDQLLLGGILISTGQHLFLADTPKEKEQQQWVDDITYLETLNSKTVIPGHLVGKSKLSPESMAFTKKYIETFIQAEKKTKDSQELMEAMKKAYPDLKSGNLELSAKVALGEQAWDEVPVSSDEVLTLATETNPFAGKIAEVQFETGFHFKLSYTEDNKMTWISLSGENKGQSETEPIYVHKLGENLYTVNWIESTGVSVSHNINIVEGTVWAFMSWNNPDKYGKREVLLHGGTWTIVNEIHLGLLN